MGSHSRKNETKPRKRRFNGNHYKQTGRRGTSEVTQQQQEPQQQHSRLLLTDNMSLGPRKQHITTSDEKRHTFFPRSAESW